MDEEAFELMRQLLSVFHDSIDGMNLDQRRAAIRTLVRKVIWDGSSAHVILFGASEDEADIPAPDGESGTEADAAGEDGNGCADPDAQGASGSSVTRLCEDSK